MLKLGNCKALYITYECFMIICIFSIMFFIWTNSSADTDYKFAPMDNKKLPDIYYAKGMIDLRISDRHTRQKIHYRRKRDLKFILVWSAMTSLPFSVMKQGRRDFERLRCPITKCYVTSNVSFFNDVRDFDVIAFTGSNMDKEFLPENRARFQKYIYFNMNSSASCPVNDAEFDGFFNGTATYKLDSDLPLPHILVRDEYNVDIGPNIHINWEKPKNYNPSFVQDIKFNDKKQAAVIYMSECKSLSPRKYMLERLQKELIQLGYAIDVWGPCGYFKCKTNMSECYEKWKKNYYYYLVYESVLDVDYVSDNLLIPLKNSLVPVVYGGADYTRFLPPESYLNAMKLSPKQLAKIMVNLIRKPEKYLQYFWWKSYYSFHDPKVNENICNICSAVHNNHYWRRTEKMKKFRVWWNINYTALV
ncbi:alpha-(1,3)-fucosyltransferase C-like [Plodia interpunctella]|uniref:alpha-(1,3)-fucosyltransferase C-like n=1 Tax=Plodia interpunctella TaxID=58824 RepID=UPI002367461E|nr:alpha-(1,3)-fucosyltransferase C-like [Plodia interpunctella]